MKIKWKTSATAMMKNMMSDDHNDDHNIVETIKEEVAEAAKAVAADVKSIAHDIADAITEGKAELCGEDTHPAPPTDAVKAVLPTAAEEDNAPR